MYKKVGRESILPIPVNVFSKKGMSFDLFPSVTPQTPRGIALQKARHYTSCLWRHVWREVEWICENPLIHCIDVFVIKRWETSLQADGECQISHEDIKDMADHHFVQQYTQRPPVDRFSIPLTLQKFWSDVLWGPAKG